MKTRPFLGATYRLQFNRDFTFAHAAALIPYLQRLGITHIYASPLLKARAGSPHGYDIVDHNALNPELGDAADFTAFVETLHRHGMGLILDIVPNHMGVGNDNRWWLDVLEHGESSPYAAYFDIDWQPINTALHNKVLLPLLGDYYGAVLERGELVLAFDSDQGAFDLRYFEHCVPLDPRTYPQILDRARELARQQPGIDDDTLAALDGLIADCRSLPLRTAPSAVRRQARLAGAAACKRRLATLSSSHPLIRVCIERSVTHCNGMADDPDSFDALHGLLEAQAYRLSYWLVATDQINYRRFFDINELAGIRMDNPAVFNLTHGLIRTRVAAGDVDGLRIDHVDGLSDPYGYCRDLQRLMDGAQGSASPTAGYVFIEKILASYEHLPADWPVTGTTGYEAAHLLNGLFVYPGALPHMTRIYTRFSGNTEEFDDILYHCKHLIIHGALASELNVLANLAGAIAQADRHTRDFTYQRLRDALANIVACFPVYRTYITPRHSSEEDRRYLHWAIAQAKKRGQAMNVQVYDFLQRLLSLDFPAQHDTGIRRLAARLVSRFQQYTAPVMAKGMEDTTFYIYNRLVSLNDVGFNPRIFGMSVNAFHLENRQRLETRADTLIATSTHDSKRGEDVRACIDVLSEIPHVWQRHLLRWSRFNLSKKRLVGDRRAPSRNDEYLLYQTLIGAWPLGPTDAAGSAAFRERIEAYMLKAIKEAKVHTSWINPDEAYETAMRSFVGALLDASGRNPFLADFMPFQQRIARFGLLNGLAQTLLKLTIPGVPDIYQGNELWALNLADPDNRRPVGYTRRQTLLDELRTSVRNRTQLPTRVTQWIEHLQDGRIKLYVTWRALTLRRDHPRLFGAGQYLGLEVTGALADHICAFARRLDDDEVIVATARWFARLATEHDRLPLGPVWDHTRIHVPVAAPELPSAPPYRYRNVFTEETVALHTEADACFLDAAELFVHLPFALLVRADEPS